MHFDDGMDEIITLPDNTVRLTGEAVVARCKCARCAVRPEADDGGCTLPLPQPAARGALNRAKPGMANGVPHPGRALFRPSLS